VNFIAVGAGGTGVYQYQFSDNVSGVMTVVKPYSGSSDFVWNTTGVSNGTYQVKVDVRSQGSTSASEATASTSYTIGLPAATGVTLTPHPLSPQLPGTSVTWVADATGGTGIYEYQFWLFSGGGWSMVQAYGMSTAWSWDTTGLATGRYEVQVRARSLGSTAAYEAVVNSPFTLSIPAATGVTLTPSPLSPQASGTSVTWTAVASGGSGTYEYEIYIWTTDWSIVKAYAVAGNTYVWTTTGLAPGNYYFAVFARSAGSTAPHEAVATATFAIGSSTPPTSVTLTPSPISPEPPGTTSVTWTAVASGGGGSYEYEIYYWTGGNWSVVKARNVQGNTFVWDTTGLAPGNYYFAVFAWSFGSTSSHDVVGTATAVLQ